MISECYVHRGYCIEQFYCPMDPKNKIDHILVPELEVGFLTLNDYHDMEARECNAEIAILDMREFINWNNIEKYSDVIALFESDSSSLMTRAIENLGKAKQEHDVLESYYVPNMNFGKIANLTNEWICKIERNEL